MVGTVKEKHWGIYPSFATSPGGIKVIDLLTPIKRAVNILLGGAEG